MSMQLQALLKPTSASTSGFTPIQTGFLQRKCACGNHTMARDECAECSKKKRFGLQTKLMVNEPGDIYEREADRIADQMMAAPAHHAVNGAPPRIQRFAGQTTTAPASVDRVLASSGRPLEPALRQEMGQRFGHDFSRVRVHSDAEAEQSARDVNAHAYTVGHNIVFGAGQFAPGTHDGRRLIAHELTHVVQQSGSHGIRIGQGDERYGRSPIAIQMQHDKDLTPADKTRVATRDPVPLLETPAKLHLFVDIDVKELGFSDLKRGNVGHTWVSLEYKDPMKVPATIHSAHKPYLQTGGKYSDPMGFWPATNEDIYYSVNPLKPLVKGWMRHPDREHEGKEKATETWDITEPAVEMVIKYAESKRSALYSVYDYNCTTFAKEAIEASGKSTPSMSSWGFAMPNAAYDGIKARQEKGIGTTSVKDFDTGKETVVNGPDETHKKR